MIFQRRKEGKCDAICQESTPLPLRTFCALRCLGRGWTFDDVSENTGISEEVIRTFIHKFTFVGSAELYNKFVVSPTAAEGARYHTEEGRQAGLPGCVGSTNGLR